MFTMPKNLFHAVKSALANFDKGKAFANIQNFVPQNALSEFVGSIAKSDKVYIKTPLIYGFSRVYGISLAEYERGSLTDYHSFNDFFTRELKDGQRPFSDDEQAVACPADGTVSQIGEIVDGQILQAKGRNYSVAQLLASHEDGEYVKDGAFATIYLAPSNYHRVHMPFDGVLVETRYVPGDLFSVNNATASHIPDLFARNERLVCVFDTAFGRAFVVLVGAMIVAGIECIATGKLKRSDRLQVAKHTLALKKGDELGRFYLGSTVIVVLPKTAKTAWHSNFAHGRSVKMGETLGQLGIALDG